MHQNESKITGYGGSAIDAHGIRNFEITSGSLSFRQDIYVAHRISLIGFDILDNLNFLISIKDTQLNRVHICIPETSPRSILKQKFRKLFDSDTLGHAKNFVLSSAIDATITPVISKAHHLPFAMKDHVEKEVEKLCSLCVLQPCTSASLENNLTSIAEMKVPYDKQSLASALGLFSHYRKFLPSDYSSKAANLDKLLRKNVAFKWTEGLVEQFKCLHKMLLRAKPLSMYIPLAETIVTCDASKIEIGGELSKLQDNGEYKTVSCFSRSKQKVEKNIVFLNFELACYCTYERFERFLWGKHFTLKSDHKSLLQLINGEIGDGVRPLRHAHWSARLLRYDFTVVHKPGKSNAVADAITVHLQVFSERFTERETLILTCLWKLTLYLLSGLLNLISAN